MGIKQIIAQESDTVTEKTIRIPFEFLDTGSVPEGKQMDDCITITPLTVRSWFKLKPLLLAIEKEDLNIIMSLEKHESNTKLPEIMAKYDLLILEIVCIGIHNKKSDPPIWFREVLRDNCTWEDTRILLNAILYRIGFNSFCKSIMTLKSMSPMSEAEIIAAQRNQESWITL